PRARPLPADWSPADVGYSMVGVHVRDFDVALERLERASAPPVAPPVGAAGARRACVRDPEGILLELMEDDPRGPARRERPRPEVGPAVRFVTLSVPDLERSQRTFRDVLGL